MCGWGCGKNGAIDCVELSAVITALNSRWLADDYSVFFLLSNPLLYFHLTMRLCGDEIRYAGGFMRVRVKYTHMAKVRKVRT